MLSTAGTKRLFALQLSHVAACVALMCVSSFERKTLGNRLPASVLVHGSRGWYMCAHEHGPRPKLQVVVSESGVLGGTSAIMPTSAPFPVQWNGGNLYVILFYFDGPPNPKHPAAKEGALIQRGGGGGPSQKLT